MPRVTAPGMRHVPGEYRCRTFWSVFGIACATILSVVAAVIALLWWATNDKNSPARKPPW